MAIGTGLLRRSIEEHLLSVDLLEEFVAAGASDISVFAFKGEGCSLVVIKGRRLPLGGVVAVSARSYFVGVELDELAAVRVFVALFAFLRRLLEVHINELGFQIWRFVAVDTGDCTMRALQAEGCRVVVEAIQFTPGLGSVAGLATHRLAVLPDLFLALLELTMVDILMACGAGQIGKVIRDF